MRECEGRKALLRRDRDVRDGKRRDGGDQGGHHVPDRGAGAAWHQGLSLRRLAQGGLLPGRNLRQGPRLVPGAGAHTHPAQDRMPCVQLPRPRKRAGPKASRKTRRGHQAQDRPDGHGYRDKVPGLCGEAGLRGRACADHRAQLQVRYAGGRLGRRLPGTRYSTT